ncbi:hypothetical protein UlMin_020910 [Ulmus minor]
MDPPPPQPSSTSTTPKLRMMCSFGGHIVHRPRTKSLCYVGGETRIVSINPLTTTSLSSLTAHLSASLSLSTPFSLKYQLPNHELDSLISLLVDEDLLIMIDELQRLSPPSRIRLFVFASKLEVKSNRGLVIGHPKTESWFCDALESAKILQKGRNCLVGFDGDGLGEFGVGEERNGGGELGNGVGSMAESMVLETSSSFGSTSSSASLTNLAAIKSNFEEGSGVMVDSKVKFTSPETIASENSVSSAIGACQDSVPYHASTDSRVTYIPVEWENKMSDVSSGVQVHRTVLAPGYALNPPVDQLHQPNLQYIQLDSTYMPQNTAGLMPISSFYPVYPPQLHQQQLLHLQYQPNQPSPVYFLPIAPAQSYSLPHHHGLIENTTIPSCHTTVPMNVSYLPPQVAQKERPKVDASPNLASQVYQTAYSPNLCESAPLIHVPYTESQKQHQPESHAVTYWESPKHSDVIDDEFARLQIYKSQPPPPSSPSRYQSMSKATTALLSEALAHLHIENLKQQSRTPPAQ